MPYDSDTESEPESSAAVTRPSIHASSQDSKEKDLVEHAEDIRGAMEVLMSIDISMVQRVCCVFNLVLTRC